MSNRRRSDAGKGSIGMVLAAIAVGVLFVLMLGFPYWTADTVSFTVSEKERIQDGNSSKYLIFTESEVFENSDSLMRWKWGSSDMYGAMKEDITYTAEVYGWRVPFLSMYRNIVSITEVKESK